MSSYDHREASRKVIVASIVIGTIITALGLAMLIAAAYLGASPADFSLELGIAIGLSGILWKCASLIRQDRPKGSTDWSALLLLVLLGASGVIYALFHYKELQDVSLTMGAAFITVWLFCLLEGQFLLDQEYELAMWQKILVAPIYPILWWMLHDLDKGFSFTDTDIGTLNVKKLLDELEVEAQLGVWDFDSPYRDPEYMREVFETTASDVSGNLGLELPIELVEWVNEQGGNVLSTASGSIITLWSWPAVRLHPVDIPYDVLIFGQERGKKGEGRSAEHLLGVDVRPGPLFGSVVRGNLLPGSRPKWPVTQPLEIVGASFMQWKNSLGEISSDAG